MDAVEEEDDRILPPLLFQTSYQVINIPFPPTSLAFNVCVSTAASTDYDLTGEVLWPMSYLLGNFLIENPEVVRGRKIIELGCGSGLAGIIAANLGAEIVLLTDGEESVVDSVCRGSMEAQSGEVGRRIERAVLKWGGDFVVEERWEEGWDVIIGSDLIYWESSVIPWCQTVHKLFLKNNKAVAYLAYLNRADRLDRIFHQALPLHNLHISQSWKSNDPTAAGIIYQIKQQYP